MSAHPTIHSFQDLIVWQKARQLTLQIYQETENFPKEEIYSLTSQIRRAGLSVAANIAEGWKRRSAKDRLHFLKIAECSNEEVKCFLILGRDLNFLRKENYFILFGLSEEIGRMLNSLILSIH